MSEDVGPFSRLRAAKPRGGALSFDALSASIADAQKSTGFVDTNTRARPPDDARPPYAEQRAAIGERKSGFENTAANREHAPPTAPDAKPPGCADESSSFDNRENSVHRKSRERPGTVQCNLRLPRDIRDALHLQALRERRTIADMVAEVMKGYLEARGTFERLR